MKLISRNSNFLQHSNSVDLSVNVDGVQVIICCFSDFKPFIVALFYGDSKPN